MILSSAVTSAALSFTSNCKIIGHFQYKIIIFQGQFSMLLHFQ